jgi:hypothetical protein
MEVKDVPVTRNFGHKAVHNRIGIYAPNNVIFADKRCFEFAFQKGFPCSDVAEITADFTGCQITFQMSIPP